ncbi:YjgF-like protein [Exidia glandulosa HHB12029]|uniref:YjgF-like protein n=1 Tax=Exidia glandulosa HHB12029 TaxID=1314781 RepID=A0A165M9R4_EXIGL|nr:YjgF-like protein [Exidia glandulosa HHB12029]
MVKKVVRAADGVPPLPVFSQGIVTGNLLYASGCIGCDNDLKLVGDDIKAQTTRALENITKVLKAAGSDLEHIVKVNVYLINLSENFAPMNEAYLKHFEGVTPPARTCVGVAQLPVNALVELELVAEIPQ